jgi:hypothetical protein
MTLQTPIETTPNLVAFWDFRSEPRQPIPPSAGPASAALHEQAGPMERLDGEGPLGHALRFREGQYLLCPRSEVGPLDLHGDDAEVSVVTWLRRAPKSCGICQAVAGLWDETQSCRQYAMFLGAMDEHDRQVGHVSDVGGPTPGDAYCQTGSVGQTRLPMNEWMCLAFTFGRGEVRSYLNGQLDGEWERNPEPHVAGLYDGGADGADFTVGAVRRGRAPGPFDNFFVGDLGGVAIFDRRLNPTELADLSGID